MVAVSRYSHSAVRVLTSTSATARSSSLITGGGELHGVGNCCKTTAVVSGLPDGRVGRVIVLLKDILRPLLCLLVGAESERRAAGQRGRPAAPEHNVWRKRSSEGKPRDAIS